MDESLNHSTKSICDLLPTEIVQNIAGHLDVASEACFILCSHFIKSIIGTSSWIRAKDDKVAHMALLSRLGRDLKEYDYCKTCGKLHGFDKPISSWHRATRSPESNKDVRPFPFLRRSNPNWSPTDFWIVYSPAIRSILREYSETQRSLLDGVKPKLDFKYLFQHALTLENDPYYPCLRFTHRQRLHARGSPALLHY